jgi:flagellar motor switch protein FliG
MGNRFDGVGSAAEMMNLLDPDTRERILSELATRDPETARRIRDRMFTFAELLKMPSAELQKAIRMIPSRKFALALRGLSAEILAPVFAAISQRGAEALREEIQGLGPQKVTVVQEARQDIAQMVLKLVADGKLSLR